MKNRFTPVFINAVAVGAVALLSQNAQSQGVVYSDTSTYEGANFNFDNGLSGSASAGQEVVLPGALGFDEIGQFQVQIDFTGTGTPTGSVDVGFYAPTGTAYNGYPGPAATALWDAGATALTAFTTGGGETLTYTVPSITVPKDFIWVVTFSGLTSTEVGGLSIYGTASVGENYHSAWVNTGSGYVLQEATGGEPALEFGSTLTNIPEPSTIALGVMGACGFLARRRKS
jgi:hypothetical protein